MSKFLCITAGQRAGTTALQSALAGTGEFHNFGEIFHNGSARKEGAFVDFAKDQNLMFTDFSTYESTNKICMDYVAHLKQLSEPKLPLIDVKYNSWGAIKPIWSYHHQEPFFLNSLKRLNTSFVMIIRRNLADQIISEHIARTTNVWHNLGEKDIENLDVTINVNLARNQARLILLTEKFIFSLLRHYKSSFFAYYEDIFETKKSYSGLIEFIQSEFNVDISEKIKFGIKKNKGDKRSLISNYDEIKTTIEEVVNRNNGRVNLQ